jgi:hypothetical protein
MPRPSEYSDAWPAADILSSVHLGPAKDVGERCAIEQDIPAEGGTRGHDPGNKAGPRDGRNSSPCNQDIAPLRRSDCDIVQQVG